VTQAIRLAGGRREPPQGTSRKESALRWPADRAPPRKEPLSITPDTTLIQTEEKP